MMNVGECKLTVSHLFLIFSISLKILYINMPVNSFVVGLLLMYNKTFYILSFTSYLYQVEWLKRCHHLHLSLVSVSNSSQTHSF